MRKLITILTVLVAMAGNAQSNRSVRIDGKYLNAAKVNGQNIVRRYVGTELVWGMEPVDAWTPLSIADCELWLDADSTSVLQVGSTVTTWFDKSGNNNHATNSNAKAFTLSSNTFNGRNALYTSGTKTMFSPSLGLASSSVTIFIAVKFEADAGFGGIMSIGNLFMQRQGGGHEQLLMYNGNGSIGTPTGSLSNSANTSLLFLRKTVGSKMEISINKGGAQSASDPLTAAYTEGITMLGIRTGFANIVNAYFGEIIIYGRAVTGDEKSAIESYLAKKWGITLTE